MIEYITQDEKDLIQVIKLSVNTSVKGYGKIVFSEHRKGSNGEIISKDSIIYIPKKVYMTILLNVLKEGGFIIMDEDTGYDDFLDLLDESDYDRELDVPKYEKVKV